MFCGVALALNRIPVELVERHRLHSRIYERGGEREIQFLLPERERILPVWVDGQLQILRWGNRRGQSPQLPCTAWTQLTTLQSGGWGDREVQEVVIPANVGLARGIWFHLTEGIRAVMVRDERERPVVYVLVEPATHYYQIMTKSEWMPVIVGEAI
jgi:hypothetical protein